MSIAFNNETYNDVKTILYNGKIVDSAEYKQTSSGLSQQIFTSSTNNTIYIKNFYNDINNSSDPNNFYSQFRVIQVINYLDDNSVSDNNLFLFARASANKDFGFIGKIEVDKDFNIQIVQLFIDEIGKYLQSKGINNIPLSETDYFSNNFDQIISITEENYTNYEVGEDEDNIEINTEPFNKYILENKNYIKLVGEQFYNRNKEVLVNNRIKVYARESGDSLANVVISKLSQAVELDTYFSYEDTNYLIYSQTVDGIKKYYLISENSINLDDEDSLQELIDGETVIINRLTFKVKIETIDNIDYATLTSENYHLCLFDQVLNNETWSFLYFPYLNNDKIEIFSFGMLKSINGEVNQNNRAIGLDFIADSSKNFDLYKYDNGNTVEASRGYNAYFPLINNNEESFNEKYYLNVDYYSYPYFNSIYDQPINFKDFDYSLNGLTWVNAAKKNSHKGVNDVPAGVISVDLEIKHNFYNINSEKITYDNNYHYYKVTDKGTTLSLQNNGDFIIYSKNTLTFKIINNIINQNISINSNISNEDIGLSYLLLRTKYNLLEDNFLVFSDGFDIVELSQEELENLTNNQNLTNINFNYKINLNKPSIITQFTNHYYLDSQGNIQKYYNNSNNLLLNPNNLNNNLYKIDSNKVISSPIKYIKEDTTNKLKDNSCGFLSIGGYIKGILPDARAFWLGLETNLSREEYNFIMIDDVLYNIDGYTLIEVNNSNNTYILNLKENTEDTYTTTIGSKSIELKENIDGSFTYSTESINSDLVCGINNINTLLEQVFNSAGLLSFPNTIDGLDCSAISIEGVENNHDKNIERFSLNEDNPYIRKISIPNNDIVYILPYAFAGKEGYTTNEYNYVKELVINNQYKVDIQNGKATIKDNSDREMDIWIGYKAFAYSDITNLTNIENKKLFCSIDSFFGSKLTNIKTTNIVNTDITLGEIFENLPELESIDGKDFI